MMDLKGEGGIVFSSKTLRDVHLIKLAWMIPLFTIITAVLIHVLAGNVRDVPFFISEADHPGLERVVFTSGLFVSACFQCLLSMRLYFLFKRKARPRILLFATILGVLSSIHLGVLAFADMYDHISLHIYTSMVVFHGGFCWAFLTHFALPNPHPKGKKLRLLSLIGALISLLVMTISIGRGVRQRREELDSDSNIIPLDALQPWIDVAAPAEFILFFSLLGCLASFSWDIHDDPSQLEDTSIE